MKIKDILEAEVSSKNMSKTQNEICRYLLDNYDSIDKLDMYNIAKNCYCSTTSVHRTIKKLGFKSIVEFKYAYNQEIINEHHKDEIEELITLSKNINYENMREFSKIIKKSEQLYLFGDGPCEEVSISLYRSLLIHGIIVCSIKDSRLIENFKKGVLLCISANGDEHTTLNITQIAKKNGLDIISITKENTELANISKLAITHKVNLNEKCAIKKNQVLHFHLIVGKLVDEIKILSEE